MPNIPHDHNFKNILLDFPEESLQFFFPKALEQWGAVKKITFVREEPKKHHLSDANLVLDMPDSVPLYTVNNPVVKILLPKMNYVPSERTEVIRQAYTGLFQLAALSLFEKYVPFIDLYAEVKPEEQKQLCHELFQHEETAMLAEYIKDMGRKEGRKEGEQKGYKKMISMIRNAEKKGLSVEVIAEIAQIDVGSVEKILNNEQIDIPLHLLDENISH